MVNQQVRWILPKPSQSPPRRTQEDRREESDRRILRAAIRLIARNGSAGTSMAEIGLAAGYSRGLPSERFGTKDALLRSVVATIEEAFQARLAGDLGDKTGLAAVEARVGAHLDGALKGAAGVRALYLLYMESLTVAPDLHAQIAQMGHDNRDGLAAHLREAQRLGEINRDIDSKAHAMVILGAIRGIITQWVIDPRAVDLLEAKAVLVSMVQRLAGRPRSGR
ncbi:TetR/AcrR family transcriptional regulator [Reyranella sp.]|uniref:TetR/AcrR family transcriptional regulator n=1 Tax=Reyranella sp. TaxID=1929291 RepID=UPI003D109826